MKKNAFCLLALAWSLSSCSKTAHTAGSFQAIVLGADMDCGIYDIKFLPGTDNIQPFLTGVVGTDSVCVARNLPDALKIPGLKIVLSIRKPKDSEVGACTMMGITHPWTYVLTARN